MDQEPIRNRTALSANCTTMDAERLAAIGALVQQQNQKNIFLEASVFPFPGLYFGPRGMML